jgi:methionine sulfoxide reductase heme-binding subunit
MTRFLDALFWSHDAASALLAKYFLAIKRFLLIAAHVSLLGLFFPAWRQDFGEAALILLAGVLFLSPISKILRTRFLLQLMGLRRELGILMGYLATVHVVGFLIDPDWFNFLITPYWPGDLFSMDIRYQLGFAAYFLTLPLLLTSNAWMNRLLGGKNWKRLHRLVYPLFALALFHKFFRPGDMQMEDAIVPALVFAGYLSVKLLAWRNELLPLERLIVAVAVRYRAYGARQATVRPPV